MASRGGNIWTKLDWVTVLLYLAVLVLGWLNIYSASYNPDNAGMSQQASMQIVWMGVSFVAVLLIMLIDVKVYQFFAYFIYAALIVLLVATIFLAPNIKGSHSWLVMGPIRLQPAEFAKIGTALALARLMSSYDFSIQRTRCFWQAVALVVLPIMCIILQRETGSALVFLAFFLVFFREGMTGMLLLLGALAVVLFVLVLRMGDVQMMESLGSWGLFAALAVVLVVASVVLYVQRYGSVLRYLFPTLAGVFAVVFALNKWTGLAINFTYVGVVLLLLMALMCLVFGVLHRQRVLLWLSLFVCAMVMFCFSVDYIFERVLEPHQQIRIKVLLGMADDPMGVGYNVNQSKIAIGSGGFLGKGYLNGTQTKLSYVPEQVTDFIFCNIGEEFGFVGSVAMLLLYGGLIVRLLKVAERQFDPFCRVYGYCVVSIFLFHLIVNVGMVLGLMPVIGIPLLLVSYGGSSLLASTMLLFLFLRLDASRTDQLH